jgi:hypothetical protein
MILKDGNKVTKKRNNILIHYSSRPSAAINYQWIHPGKTNVGFKKKNFTKYK